MPLFKYFLVERMAGASLFHKSKESLLLQGNSFIHGLFIHQIDMWTYYVPGAMLGMTNIPTWRNFYLVVHWLPTSETPGNYS